jgi:hypothetical protein
MPGLCRNKPPFRPHARGDVLRRVDALRRTLGSDLEKRTENQPAMTEVYCEFTQRTVEAPPAVLRGKRSLLLEVVREIRQRISDLLKGRVDAGAARKFPLRGDPTAVFVEFFFDESSIRNQLSRMIEAQAESYGVMVHVDHNTLALQRRLAAVAFAADPHAVVAALRGELPSVPLTFRAAGADSDGMRRYAVIAHNVKHIENFNDADVMDAVDGILTRRLPMQGAYRRCAKS